MKRTFISQIIHKKNGINSFNPSKDEIDHQSEALNPKECLRQDPPLEAILVIFGRRALIFFCLKALGKK